jgi:glycosyltransferase involved in cell wall biosynthesis
MTETISNVRVYRSWIYVSRSRSIVARLLNYFSFVITSWFLLLRAQRADYLLCESPPLFLGITAVAVAWIKKSRLIFNVSDLWPESAEKLGMVRNQGLLRMAYALEAWIYKRSFLITVQTQGILANIQSRFPAKDLFWFPNGVDVDFFRNVPRQSNWRERLGLSADDFVVLYAGIVGHAQGLDVIIDAAHHLKESDVKFVIVGDGPEKERLAQRCKSESVINVVFYPNTDKSEIPSLVESCDAYVVPLKKLNLFLGAIPSKLFEPLALGKPILLGVDGEARRLFIAEGEAGLYFEPGNSHELVNQVMRLYGDRALASRLGSQGRAFVLQNFDRKRIHERLFNKLWS